MNRLEDVAGWLLLTFLAAALCAWAYVVNFYAYAPYGELLKALVFWAAAVAVGGWLAFTLSRKS